MEGIDLNTYRFDYDLTFAALLMNADGTIYHVFGGRDWTDPMSHLSMPALARTLRETLADHRAYMARPRPPKKRKPLSVEQLPKWAREKTRDCYHCHMVNEAIIEDLQDRGKWTLGKAWTWPDPIQAGIMLDRDGQVKVTKIETRSAASAAGLRAGDRLLTLGGRRTLTFGDVQRALEETKPGGAALKATWERDGEERSGKLRLKKGWKRPTPRVFAWRASKWPIRPTPGFGGQALGPDQLEGNGLARDAFAFPIGYFVTWGRNARYGRNALRILRKGDIVFSIGGETDFDSIDHFHAWFRLTQKPGDTVPVEWIRKGQRMKAKLKVLK